VNCSEQAFTGTLVKYPLSSRPVCPPVSSTAPKLWSLLCSPGYLGEVLGSRGKGSLLYLSV
jgi:hypothetical protein